MIKMATTNQQRPQCVLWSTTVRTPDLHSGNTLSCAICTGLNASETWTLKEKDRSRLQAAEMRFLRSVVGVTRLDHIRNEEIRYNLKVNSLLETVDEYKQKWWEHVQRMSQDRTPKIIADYVPIGKRSIGRPAKRWIQEIKEPQWA
ncbi:hypothetical protein ANN_12509 [Periplaneta americana]|uniref:Uncharacterized protein n=1 Tax=Periplaneta americana TaxID=6978 RepID=A0ABQ8TGV2_PERAM|nr:hypothetical protein ANN_12509 [Periplaneta americana]